MRSTKKGNNHYFGMKAHIGVDAQSSVVHMVRHTPANAHDITQGANLLHGQETDAYTDSGYRGIDKREEAQAQAQKPQNVNVRWHIAMIPGKRKPSKRPGRRSVQQAA